MRFLFEQRVRLLVNSPKSFGIIKSISDTIRKVSFEKKYITKAINKKNFTQNWINEAFSHKKDPRRNFLTK